MYAAVTLTKLLWQIMKTTKLINTFNYFKPYLKFCGKYIFLHKPLCEKFRKDSFLFLNKIYLCRSCTFLYLGLFTALLLLKFIPILSMKYFLIYAIAVIILSFPRIYANYNRFLRDIVRFNNGFMFGCLLLLTYRKSLIMFASALIIMLLVKTFYNKLRHRVDICQGCPELIENTTCSGYTEQKEAFLKFEENYCKNLIIEEGDIR